MSILLDALKKSQRDQEPEVELPLPIARKIPRESVFAAVAAAPAAAVLEEIPVPPALVDTQEALPQKTEKAEQVEQKEQAAEPLPFSPAKLSAVLALIAVGIYLIAISFGGPSTKSVPATAGPAAISATGSLGPAQLDAPKHAPVLITAAAAVPAPGQRENPATEIASNPFSDAAPSGTTTGWRLLNKFREWFSEEDLPELTAGLTGPAFSPNAAQIIPKVEGVVWDREDPLAILGGKPRRIGDTTNGWTVQTITPDEVTLSRNGAVHTVSLLNQKSKR